MGAEDDKVFYGGGESVTIVSSDGMSNLYAARDLILTAEFEVATAKPGELASEQTAVGFLLTFKGVDPTNKALKAVTLVFEPPMAAALIKSLRHKYVEIPIHLRG